MQSIITTILKTTNFKFNIDYYITQNNSKITFECVNGHIFSKTWRSVNRNELKCPKCEIKRVHQQNSKNFVGNTYNTIKYTTKDVSDFMAEYGYKLNEEYKGANEKHSVTCPENHTYVVTWSKFRVGRRCPECASVNKHNIVERSTGIVSSTIQKITQTFKKFNGFVWLNKHEYKNRLGTIRVKCPNNHTFETSWIIINGRSKGIYCPICKPPSFSIGEVTISRFLDLYNISYEKEKIFSNIVSFSGRKLRFDFYLPEYNLCIEYDGSQHFHPFKVMGGQKRFEEIIKSDKIKNDFCKENNINLIRIPFYKFELIEKILKESIVNGNVNTYKLSV